MPYGENNDRIDLHPYFLEQSRTQDLAECRAGYRQFVLEAMASSRRDPRMSDGPFFGSDEFIKAHQERLKPRRRKSR